jgi:hypothetical protein
VCELFRFTCPVIRLPAQWPDVDTFLPGSVYCSVMGLLRKESFTRKEVRPLRSGYNIQSVNRATLRIIR